MRAVICWVGARGMCRSINLDCLLPVGIGCVVSVGCFRCLGGLGDCLCFCLVVRLKVWESAVSSDLDVMS